MLFMYKLTDGASAAMDNWIPVQERTCFFCENEIEKEGHVLFDSDMYVKERKPLLKLTYNDTPDFDMLSADVKLKTVFESQDMDNHMIKLLAKTPWTCLEKRKLFFLDIM